MWRYIRRILNGITVFTSETALKRAILFLPEAARTNSHRGRQAVRKAFADCARVGGKADKILLENGLDVLKDVASVNAKTASFLLTAMLKAQANDWLAVSRCVVTGFKALPAIADESFHEARCAIRALRNASRATGEEPKRTFVDSGLAALTPLHERNYKAASELAHVLETVVKEHPLVRPVALEQGGEIIVAAASRHPEVAGLIFQVLWQAAGEDQDQKRGVLRMATDAILVSAKPSIAKGGKKHASLRHLVKAMEKTIGKDGPLRGELFETLLLPVPPDNSGYEADIKALYLKTALTIKALHSTEPEAVPLLKSVPGLVAIDGSVAAGVLSDAVGTLGLGVNIFEGLYGKAPDGNIIVVSSPRALQGQIGFSIIRPHTAKVEYVFGRFRGTGRELWNRVQIIHGDDAGQTRSPYYRFCQRTMKVFKREDQDIPNLETVLANRLALAMRNARRKQKALVQK